MRHKEGTLEGKKGVSLYYQCWLPNERPRAILLVVHGLAEHAGRYSKLAEYFVARGYGVYAWDLRGHGKSEGRRGYVEHFTDYLDDIEAVQKIVTGEQKGVKTFLLGHSVGGLIAALYALRHQGKLAGVILSAPMVKPGVGITWLSIVLARILSALVPKFGVAAIDASGVSRDRSVVEAYIGDPLVYHGKISARLGADLVSAMKMLEKESPQMGLPILIMHGTADRLCNPLGSSLLYERIGSKDRTLKCYQGLCHEVLNEPERLSVLADIETWLAAHS